MTKDHYLGDGSKLEDKSDITFLALHGELSQQASRQVSEVDGSLTSIFASEQRGAQLVDALIGHFRTPPHEEAELCVWLQAFKEKYSDKLHAPDAPELPALKNNLSVVLSLHVRKEIEALPTLVKFDEFACLAGSISRMGDIIEGYYGSPELQIMNLYCAKEARTLVEKGQVSVGNEQHIPTGLKYLLGFLTSEDAILKDPLYRSGLADIAPAEIFRIRAEFYGYLRKEIKDRLKSELEDICQAYEQAISGNDYTRYNELVGNVGKELEGKGVSVQGLLKLIYPLEPSSDADLPDANLPDEVKKLYDLQGTKDWPGFCSQMQAIESSGNDNLKDMVARLQDSSPVLVIINDTAVEDFVCNTYPIPAWQGYDEIVEMTSEELKKRCKEFELEQNLRILRHTGYSDRGGNNLFLQRRIEELVNKEISSAPIPPPEPHTLASLIIYGALFSEILGQYGILEVTEQDLPAITRALAVRKNGNEIYDSIRHRIPEDYKTTLLGELLLEAIRYDNTLLFESVLKDAKSREIPAVNYINRDGVTPLMRVSSLGKTGMVTLLLEHNADPTLKTLEGYTALNEAAYRGHEQVVKIILKELQKNLGTFNSEINHRQGADKSTPLMAAASNGHVEAARALIEAGADINIKSKDVFTALHLASLNGHTKIIQLFEEKLKDEDLKKYINCVGQNNATPLMLAAWNGREKAARALIDAGADISIRSKHRFTALHLASQKGHTKIIKLFKEKLNIQIFNQYINNPGLENWTPLMLAASNGHVEAARALIEDGADIGIKGKNGVTALDLSLSPMREEIAEILLQTGILPDFATVYKYKKSFTPEIARKIKIYEEFKDIAEALANSAFEEELKKQPGLKQTEKSKESTKELLTRSIYKTLVDSYRADIGQLRVDFGRNKEECLKKKDIKRVANNPEIKKLIAGTLHRVQTNLTGRIGSLNVIAYDPKELPEILTQTSIQQCFKNTSSIGL